MLGLTLFSTQLLLTSYVKTVALDAATEAAQTAALADSNEALGKSIGMNVLELALPGLSSQVLVSKEQQSGYRLSLATVRVSFPSTFLGMVPLQVEAQVIDEKV